MKRGWIALGMIALSLILGGIEYFYVTSNVNAYVKIMHNQVYEAESVAQKLDHRFSKQSGVFNIFMYHSEIGHIASDLAMLRRYAQTGSVEDFLATSACAKRKILTIKDSKSLKWGNIF